MEENTVIDLFMNSIREKSESITFIYGRHEEKEVTYTELLNKSKKVLMNFQLLGFQKGDEVIIALANNENFLYSFMACLMGGFIAIPLDDVATDTNLDRLVKIYEQIPECHLITEKRSFDNFKNLADKEETKVSLDKMEARILYFRDINFEVPDGEIEKPDKDDIALIQYSSGSTGNPKGVTITHENLRIHMDEIVQACGQTSDDIYLSWLPLHHDLGLIWYCLLPIVTNVRQYNFHIDLFLKDPLLWMEKSSEHKATILCAPNFGYKLLLQSFDESIDYGWNLESIRMIINGAEAISNNVIKEFNSKLKKYKLRDNAMNPGYGLAEATLTVCIMEPGVGVKSIKLDRDYLSVGDKVTFATDQDNCIELVLVGKIQNFVEVRITDSNHKELPDEYIGQIEIKGKCVTKGYYKEKPEGRKKYMSDDGWLNTGDIGFVIDEHLVIATRQKDVLIVDGKNLYLTDIEEVLENIKEVPSNGVITCVSQLKDNQDELVVFVKRGTIDREFAVMYKEIQRALTRKFGISIFKVLPIGEIPKTSSGKLKRYKAAELYKNTTAEEKNNIFDALMSQLKQLEAQLLKENRRLNAVSDEKLDEIKKQLIAIVSKSLRRIGLNEFDNLFELGADSIAFKRITEELVETYGECILPSSIYKYPMIGQLAEYIKEACKNRTEDCVHKKWEQIELSEEGYYELSEQQKRMYLLACMNKNSTSYNLSIIWELAGKLDVNRLEASFQELVRRHESLRTSFHLVDGKPLQKIHQEVEFSVNRMELSANNEVEAVLHNLIVPFDISKAPLLSVNIIQLGAEKNILVFDMHHIIGDGVTIRILLDELAKLYAGETLAPRNAKYIHYIQYQSSYRRSQRYQEDKLFWSDMYEEKPYERIIHTNFRRNETTNHNGNKIYQLINADLTQQLKSYGRSSNRTLFMLLFAGFSVVLSEFYDEDDISIGIPYMGRPERDFEDVVGMFVNTIAIRLKIQDDLKFSQYLSYVSDVCMDCWNHTEYQFNDLVEELHCKRQTGKNPIFDVFFSLQNTNPDELSLKNLTTKKVKFNNGEARFDLSIDIFEEDNLNCVMEYKEGLWKEDTINEFFKKYRDVLQKVCDNPDVKMKELRTGKKKTSKKKNLGLKLK